MLRVDMEGALAQLRPGRVAGNGAGAPSCADVSVEAFIEEVLALYGPYSEFVAGLDEYDDGDVGDRLGQVLTGLDWYLPHMVGLSLFEAGATFGPDCEVSIDYLIWAGSEEEAKERFDAIVAEEEEAYGPDLPLRVSYVRKAENVHRTWLNWLASGKGRNPVRA